MNLVTLLGPVCLTKIARTPNIMHLRKVLPINRGTTKLGVFSTSHLGISQNDEPWRLEGTPTGIWLPPKLGAFHPSHLGVTQIVGPLEESFGSPMRQFSGLLSNPEIGPRLNPVLRFACAVSVAAGRLTTTTAAKRLWLVCWQNRPRAVHVPSKFTIDYQSF